MLSIEVLLQSPPRQVRAISTSSLAAYLPSEPEPADIVIHEVVKAILPSASAGSAWASGIWPIAMSLRQIYLPGGPVNPYPIRK